jgi:4-alpha-glucanotransferase
MNLPSTIGRNWLWRMQEDALSPELAGRLLEMSRTYGRLSD